MKSSHPRDGIYASPPSFKNQDIAISTYLKPELDDEASLSPSLRGSDYYENPAPPTAQLLGAQSRDWAALSRAIMPDGAPDVWIRFSPRNLRFALGRGVGSLRGIRLRALILRTKGGTTFRQWDTLLGSPFPLLQAENGGRLLNDPQGGLSGISLDEGTNIDLYFADEELTRSRRSPLELEIETEEGTLKLPVRPVCTLGEARCL